ncbi:MAG: AAA family ATPase [Bacteroidaceae bacterium]|nr:AAA family ATPase [Bacteroidaceae bacterium]
MPTQNTIDTENPQFKNALNLIQFTNQSVFLTGKAGTGKSTFLKYICQTTKKKYVVLAPTGIAAINAGGCTMHSFFHLPFHPLVPDDNRFSTPNRLKQFLKYNKEKIKLIKSLELIIIDEISMVRADIIDFIDRLLRIYSGCSRQPFGGKQMLLVGDVFQLEPVVTRDEQDILSRYWNTPHFFSANVFREMQLVSIELTKVYRQTDGAFISVLDHIRTNNVSSHDLQLLNTCVGQDVSSNNGMFVTLATRRDVVDSINQTNLNAIEGDAIHFKGEIKGEFPESSLPTLLDLELKVGAQIIFIKNDQDKRWVNGTIGTITGIDLNTGDHIYVLTDEGKEMDVERAQWANVRYTFNEEEKKIDEEELGTFTQFPVRLAWAITIHKSQGLTFSRTAIDFTGGVFAGGMTYVALSRCRSLDGLQLKKPITQSDIFVNPNIAKFAQQFNDQRAVDMALKRAGADIEYSDAIEAFNKGDFDACLTHFFKAIHARYDIEKPWAWRYIRRKLGTINILKDEIKSLKKQLDEKQTELDEKQHTLNEYAKEYLQLGDECMKMDDPNAAIRNYDKALRMNPRNVEAYISKARTQLGMLKYQDALSAINNVFEIVPSHFKALYTRGKIFFEMQEYELACGDLDRCTSMKSDNISAHQLFGDILSAMDKEEEAAIQWAIAEQLRKKLKSKR